MDLDKICQIVVNNKERKWSEETTTLRDVSDFCFQNGAFISQLAKNAVLEALKDL